jgi:hypothetical protein
MKKGEVGRPAARKMEGIEGEIGRGIKNRKIRNRKIRNRKKVK